MVPRGLAIRSMTTTRRDEGESLVKLRYDRLALAAALTVTAGCSNPNGVDNGELARSANPVGAGGVYVLQSVNGAAIPAVLVLHESYRMRILADTLYLYADGTGGLAMSQAVLEGQATAEILRHEVAPLNHTLTGIAFQASIPCDISSFAQCLASPHFVGELSANTLVMTSALNFAGPLRFTRVADELPVQSVRIQGASEITIGATGQAQLGADVVSTSGAVVAGERVSWHSLLPSVATVDASGVVRPVAEGLAPVVAFAKGRTDTVRVTVRR
jgi:hypothetical protein